MVRQRKIKVLFIAAVNEDIAKPCMPGFVTVMVSVNKTEYNDGDQFDLAEAWLRGNGFGEPFVLFAEEEAPKWLMAAFEKGCIKGVTPAAWRRAVTKREQVFAGQIG